MVMIRTSRQPPAEFEELVRDVLLHLYDAGYLMSHPLAQHVDVAPGSGATARGKRLLQAMLDAIEAFRPAPGAPADARARRVYRLLELRYIGGLSASDVMARLDISKSQYQRDHAHALESLALALWDRWDRGQKGPHQSPEPESRESLALTEVEQLTGQMNPDYVDLAELLDGLLRLMHPIAEENGVALTLQTGPALPTVRGDRVALRQVFLGLLNAALGCGVGGAIEIAIGQARGTIVVTLSAQAPKAAEVIPLARGPELEVARRFVEALGGELVVELPTVAGPWRARVTLPISRRPIVLVVDNHPDFVDLVARYLGEGDWQVVGAEDVRRGQALALELRPTVVLLDVMMPGQDGWDMLLALRARPETKPIPVIICSVLYEPQVARALGAATYLAKPISQTDLLQALAPYWAGAPGLGSVG
jgi:CheY-like chemotaxis protein